MSRATTTQPIRDGETWEDYVYRCRALGETIRQAEARLLKAGAIPPEPRDHARECRLVAWDYAVRVHGATPCTCEGVMDWGEGSPHMIRITDPDCPEHHEEGDQ